MIGIIVHKGKGTQRFATAVVINKHGELINNHEFCHLISFSAIPEEQNSDHLSELDQDEYYEAV